MIEFSQIVPLHDPAVPSDGKAGTCDDRFATLVLRQSKFVFGVAYSILRNSHDAEDVVQEVFLKLYRSGAWRDILDERAFLARAAWRMSVDRLPKRRTEPPSDELRSDAGDPETAAIAADWNATLHRLIDGLPEDLRQPLALSTLDGMTSRQIGMAMGLAEGTVRTRLMRARQVLKQKLEALRSAKHES